MNSVNSEYGVTENILKKPTAHNSFFILHLLYKSWFDFSQNKIGISVQFSFFLVLDNSRKENLILIIDKKIVGST